MGRIRVMRIIARMNVGGPAVQISGLMRGLDPEIFDQTLVTGFCAEDEADYLETQAPDVQAMRIQGLGRAVRGRDDALALTRLVRLIRELTPDIIHTHTAKAGMLGRTAAKLARSDAHLTHTFHGHLLHGYFSPVGTRALIEIERGLAKVTDRLVAVGPEVRDDLVAAGVGVTSKFSVIPPGLELGVLPSRESARAQLGIPPDQKVVLMLGRLTAIKRPDRFAQVVTEVSREYAEATFLVAGDGDKAMELAGICSQRQLPVKMLGWRSDVEVLLAASDVLILTSDNEGTPLSLIQAALAGVPVVSTNVGSVRHIVEDGKTGILTPQHSAALTEGVLNLLGNRFQASEMGKAARTRARRRFGVERLVRDHERLYLNEFQ